MKIVYYIAICLLHLYFQREALSTVPLEKQLCFLTLISLHLNSIYFIYMLLSGLKLLNRNDKNERFAIKFLFSLGFTVTVVFWLMYTFVPHLLMRPNVTIPLMLNLFIHGGSFLLLFIEITFVQKRLNCEDCNYKTFTIFSAGYGVYLKLIYMITGFAAYPFVATNIEFVVVLAPGVGFCLLGEVLYNKILEQNILGAIKWN